MPDYSGLHQLSKAIEQHPLNALRRVGVVSDITNAPTSIFVAVGGDTANTVPAAYMTDLYTPVVNDTVALIVAGGDYLVIGALGKTHVPSTSGVTATTGNTINNSTITKYGRVVQMTVNVTLGSVGAGNIGNLHAADISNAGNWPAFEAVLSSGSNGIGMSGYVDTAGGIFVASTELPSTQTNYLVTLNGTWLSAT